MHQKRALPLLLLAACAGESHPTGPAEDRPNVLLFTLDTTRADHLSCYGAAGGTSPNIDRIAQDGVRYERCISTAGITPMSHASILTGLNNYRHGMRVFFSEDCTHRLKDSVDSLPEVLSDRGYRTAAAVSAYVVSEIYNLNQGFDTFLTGADYLAEVDTTHQLKHEVSFSSSRSTNTQRRGDATVDDALGWLGEVAAGEAPWFLWIHLFDVHDYSLIPPIDYLASKGIEPPPEGTDLRPAQQAVWRSRLYDPELYWMDGQVGRVLDQLQAAGVYDDTLVVITADHGQGLEEGQQNHGWSKHRLLFEWCTRVPLLVKLPQQDLAGTVVPTQVRSIDIAPTVLDILGLAVPKDVEGLSALGLARGGIEDAPRMAYSEALNLYDAHSPSKKALPDGQYDNMYAVGDGRWKLVLKEQEPEKSELYFLAEDPQELSNLYRADHEEVLRLKAYLDARRPWEVEKPGPEEVHAASADALEGLGYGGGADEEDEDLGDK